MLPIRLNMKCLFLRHRSQPISLARFHLAYFARSVVLNRNKTQFIVESIAYDSEGNEVGRGNGVFVRGKFLLSESRGY